MNLVRDKNQLYEEIVIVTSRYLGPAADRFVSRQCQNHLNKRPEQLRPKDLKSLISWFSLAMGLLSEDPELVMQFESELQELAGRSR
ncbi:MAG TPA: hypothetical protein VN554_02060 [Verrucomicrobiae bacterium]|nr:hypothetical protein [Verrucomicrobiae bacterium]